MIFGIGCDIAKVSRFESWARNTDKIKRFYNAFEISETEGAEYYAARFAAKEAFSKALGTGVRGFLLTEVYITKNELGKPELNVSGKAKDILEKLCGPGAAVHVSLSHEKEYAMAYVVIERG